MKRLILCTFCMAILFACTTEQAQEPVTEVGIFTSSVWTPELLNGQVKSIEMNSYWATDENGEFIQGALMTKEDRKSIGWIDDTKVYFNSDGMVVKNEDLDDKGEAYQYTEITVEN